MHYVVRENTPLGTLPTDLEQVHLTRPLSGKKIKLILHRCPGLRIIGLSPSVEKRFSPEAKKMLNESGINLTRNHRAGRALNIDISQIKVIADLKKDFLSLREISKRTGIPKSTIHYLLKKAKRTKLKKGKQVIYV